MLLVLTDISMLTEMEKSVDKQQSSEGTVQQVPEGSLAALVGIMDVVRRGHGLSRAEIAERTGLSRSIVSERVAALLTGGLVRETVAASTGGRPPRSLELRADAGYLAVADIGASSIDAGITDLGGRVLAQASEAADVNTGPAAILGRIDALFAGLLAGATGSAPLWGIGVGVPGPVEFRTGRPISPPIMPGWDRYPLRGYLMERYGVPAWVDNDVNVMALGESRHGVARGHADVIVVKVGTGIGSGVISDGMMHRGAQGAAGDVGHIRVVGDTELVCRCGKVGCLEAFAGGAAIARDGEVLARSGRSPHLAARLAEQGALTAEDVGRAAAMGDGAALDLLVRSGRLVGETLAALVNFFNPSMIVIGGRVARAGDEYLAVIREVVYARSLPLATRSLDIQPSSLGGQAGVRGAAAMVLDQIFSEELLGRWVHAGTPTGLHLDAA